MKFRVVLLAAFLLSSPLFAADSAFVDGAFNGSWGASFPPFIPNILGPIEFMQVSDAEGIAGMDQVAGAGTAARLCPAASEKSEYYTGEYDYQKVGRFFACTNGDELFGVYRDHDNADDGSIHITGTFPDENPPRWTGTFTNRPMDTGDMVGVLLSGGIATPLARVGAQPPALTSLSGASYSASLGFAPSSFVSGFGQNLASDTFVDSALPTSLGGVMVLITDSAGQMHNARLYVVSPTQINYLIPAGVATGMATVEVIREETVIAAETLTIEAVSPGLFSADASGQGVAAAVFQRADADGTIASGLIYDPNTLEPIALDFGPEGAQLYISLFGTGMRNFSGEAKATIDGVDVGVAGPVAQPQFEGLDQINLGPIPAELEGRGEVDIVVTVDGKQANVVTVTL